MFGWFKKRGRKFGGSHIVVTPNGGVSRKGFNQFDILAATLDWKYDLNSPEVLDTVNKILNSTELDAYINQEIVDNIRTTLTKVVSKGYFREMYTGNDGYIASRTVKANVEVIKSILDNTYTRLV